MNDIITRTVRKAFFYEYYVDKYCRRILKKERAVMIDLSLEEIKVYSLILKQGCEV